VTLCIDALEGSSNDLMSINAPQISPFTEKVRAGGWLGGE